MIDLDGVRARFADGWGLLRTSNTQAALVMRCEARCAGRLAEIKRMLEAHLAAAEAEPRSQRVAMVPVVGFGENKPVV